MKRTEQIKLMKINRKSLSSLDSSIRFRQRAAKLSVFKAKNSGSTEAAVCPSSTTSYITARILASRVTVYTLSPSPDRDARGGDSPHGIRNTALFHTQRYLRVFAHPPRHSYRHGNGNADPQQGTDGNAGCLTGGQLNC